MASTKADMRNLVLRYLSRLPEGQDVPAHDASVVEGVIDRAQAFLESEGLAYWETSAIPDGVGNAYREYVAAMAAPELMEPKRAAPYVSREGKALSDIRRFCAKANTTIRAEFF
jgi:arabinogalactan endo-1,4-beta-galactosidase